MKTQILFFLAFLASISDSILAKKQCPNSSKRPQSKLICYYSKLEEVDNCFCSHVILPPNADVKGIEKVKEDLKGVKVYVSVYEFNEGLINLLKSSKVDGLEINLRKFDSKNDIADFISTVKTKLGTDLEILLAVPSKADLVAKYFDFKALSKNVDVFVLQTAFLGASTNVTFHPSRLSGMWDMQNTDSVVDLVSGLGAPLSKVAITAPVQGFHFILQNEEYSAPGSPALELKTLDREELCKTMNSGGNWTLERDEDQAGPYIFSKNEWISFEDEKSIDIKAKYSRIRGLAGIALKDLSLDSGGSSCGPSVLEATYNGLSRQARAPRGAVLHSLEREILESSGKSLESVHLSPFRISRIIDTEGKIHAVRQDSRTEFHCSRQGYFVHPRSCNRFYRCVKFNQQTEDFNVFEFDCPAGLAFDERVEVCVWPGSLPHGTPCSGSSEIAPVPKTRFECPSEPGYYADPENCRWFFACLDHGKSPLMAYEFRCPFGLAFDGERLVCEWPWMVPKCASSGGSAEDFGYYGTGLGYSQYGNGINAGQQGLQGTVSPGIILQNYDGLGQLNAIKLGGLAAGTYKSPVSKVYSTAGITGGQIGNGLTYNALQSLQHAGLLKVNNGAAVSYNNQNLAYNAGTGLNQHGSTISYGQKVGGFLNLQQQQNLNGAHEGHSFANVHSTVAGAGSYQADNNINTAGNTGEYGSGQYSADQYNSGAYKQSIGAQHHTQSYENNIAAGVYAANAQNLEANIQHGGAHYASTYGQGNAQYNAHLNNANSYDYNANQNIANTYAYGAQGKAQYAQNLGANIQHGFNYAYAQGNSHANQNNANLYLHNSQANSHYDGESNIYGTHQVNSNLGGVYYQNNDDSKNLLIQNNGAQLGNAEGTQSYGVNRGSSNYNFNSDYNDNHAYVDNLNKLKGTTAYQVNSGLGDISTTGYQNGLDVQHHSFDQTNNENLAGHVNIVGGGYSAVGSHGSGIYSSNNGEYTNLAIPAIPVTSVSPITIVTSAPTVTSVQFPKAHSSVSYNGGVVANIPELQYKVHSNGEYGLQNVSNYASIISSTPSPFVTTTSSPISHSYVQTYITSGGYIYNKPSGGFEENSNTYVSSTLKPLDSINQQGYISNKPSVVFEELAGKTPIQPQVFISSTIKPTVDTVQPFVSSTFQPQINVEKQRNDYEATPVRQGYVYERPSIPFEEKPIGPQVFISSTPSPQVNIIQDEYLPQKPGISFTYSTPKPTISVQTSQHGATSYQTFNNQVEQHSTPNVVIHSYSDATPKPPITYEPKPQVFVSTTPLAPTLEQTGYVYNKPEHKLVQPEIISKFHISEGKSHSYNYQSNQNSGYHYEQPAVVSNQNIDTKGYHYQTPKVVFEEKNVQPAVVTYEQNPQVFVSTTPLAPTLEQTGYVYNKPEHRFVQPETVSKFHISEAKSNSYNYQSNQNSGYYYEQPSVISNQNTDTKGYQYKTPEVVFEDKHIQPTLINLEQKSQVFVSTTPLAPTLEQTGYVYKKPEIVSQFHISEAKSNSHKYQSNQNSGYYYEQPSVAFKQEPVQPAIHQHINTEGYQYKQPNVIFEEKPVNPALVSYTYSKQPVVAPQHQPVVELYKQPQLLSTYTYQKPAVYGTEYRAPTSPYTYQNVALQSVGYTQPKQPEITYIPSTTYKPQIVEQYQSTGLGYGQKTNYHNSHQDHIFGGSKCNWCNNIKAKYNYPKPTINFQDTPQKVGYDHSNSQNTRVRYTYSKPQIKFEENSVLYSTPKPVESYNYPQSPVVFTEKPVVYSTIKSPVVEKQPGIGYTYPKPQIKFEETPVIYSTPKPIVVQQQSFIGYTYPKPSVAFKEKPEPFITFENQVPIVEEPFVKKTAYVTGQNVNHGVVEDYYYKAPPTIQTYVNSTPKPTFVSTIRNIAAKNLQSVTPASIYQYDSRLTPTPQPEIKFVSSTPAFFPEPQVKVVSTTSRPISKFSFSSLDDKYQYNQYQQELQYQYQQPAQVYLPVSTTELPVVSTLAQEYLPVSTAEPTREYIPLRQKVIPAQPTKEYLPARQNVRVISSSESPRIFNKPGRVVESYVAPRREYLPAVEVTTPTKEYLPVTNPPNEYLPVRNRVRVTSSTLTPEITTLNKEYLPARQRVRLTSTVTPIVTPVRTIIKQNDAHPLLSAKLGAQCTCISPSLHLRKNQKLVIVTTDEDYDENDINGNNEVENYSFQPDKIVEITPAPEVYVKSSTGSNEYLPPRRYEIKKRVRVRPTSSPVTEISEIFLRNGAYRNQDDADNISSIKEVSRSRAVKLVKQAVKEGTEETIRKNFDRYGPGGLRSRSETLQGSIDCQRAGLFRHPTQCNKFYSCRWDCTKNKFTLHIFNCPVHLTFDDSMGACNWPSQGPACVDGTLISGE